MSIKCRIFIMDLCSIVWQICFFLAFVDDIVCSHLIRLSVEILRLELCTRLMIRLFFSWQMKLSKNILRLEHSIVRKFPCTRGLMKEGQVYMTRPTLFCLFFFSFVEFCSRHTNTPLKIHLNPWLISAISNAIWTAMETFPKWLQWLCALILLSDVTIF